MSLDDERDLSLYGLDSWITGHDGDDYWKNQRDDDDGETATCRDCKNKDHARCIGWAAGYNARFVPCDCPPRYHSGRVLKRPERDTWVCAWCLAGQHDACTMGLRCDCNAGRGDCWGHLPPKKLKLAYDEDDIPLVSEPISIPEPTMKRTFKW